MKLLYVTSFAEDMYNSSGKKLLRSYVNTHQKGDLLVCYENFDFSHEYNTINKIHSYDLGKYGFLLQWLEDNKDVIPEYLGGTVKEENNSFIYLPQNRKASRWFRKIAALHYAVYELNKNISKTDRYDTIIWIDSDCIFERRISHNLIEKAFNNTGAFYHFGGWRKHRDKGVESGFIGFQKKNYGFNLLDKVFDMYTLQLYRKLPRWEDGYIFRIVFETLYNHRVMHNSINNYIRNETVQLYGNDLIPMTSVFYMNNIIKFGIFNKYITHNKGIHVREQIMI
jgi:hypothetical protein